MKHILIAESDCARFELEKNLLELTGYSVSGASDGAEAISVFGHDYFDLVITGVDLGDTDAFGLIEEIRAFSIVPIMVVSPVRNDADLMRTFSVGGDDYIGGDFTTGEFLARAGAAIERMKRAVSKVGRTQRFIESGELRIDRFDMRVWISGEEKSLTASEFELLLYMAEHPDRVLTKEELYRVLWAEGDFVENSTIPVHMKHIRHKLSSDDRTPRFIETVWGKGYRFKNITNS